MLGQEVLYAIAQHHADIPLSRTHTPTRADLDVTDYQSVRAYLRRARPDVVINAAGAIPARGAGTVEMNRVNAMGASYVARACHDVGARLVHVSTDCVFDGSLQERPYVESDRTDAAEAYGNSKRIGEVAVLGFPEHLVVRTSFIGPQHGFWRFLTDASVRNDKVTLWRQALWSGSTARAVAEGVVELAKHDITGVYHLATSGMVSKAVLAHTLWKLKLAPPVPYVEVDEPVINRWLRSERGTITLRPLVEALEEYR